jgi:hypothetical protein
VIAETAADATPVELPEQTIALAMAELGGLAGEGDAAGFEVAAACLAELLEDVRLPSAFVRAIRAQVRQLELTANMKACDLALRRAFQFPSARRKSQRVAAVAIARFHLRRALVLGASATFLSAAERTIAAALLTDGLWPAPDEVAAVP